MVVFLSLLGKIGIVRRNVKKCCTAAHVILKEISIA